MIQHKMSMYRKIQNIIYIILDLPTLIFLILKINEWEFQKQKYSVVRYIIFLQVPNQNGRLGPTFKSYS